MPSKSFFVKASKLVFDIVKYGCVAHCVLEYVGDLVVCSGVSMEPTIFSGNIIITEHLGLLQSEYRRGDIIISRSPVDPHHFICKRIEYLAGDLVNNGLMFRRVPKGHVWLAGDNEDNSLDSRSYGPVPLALIRGRAVAKIWPLSQVQMLSDRWV
ncbi:hypothetical protein CHUAL_007195 [Chamberlinius hualienensis]